MEHLLVLGEQIEKFEEIAKENSLINFNWSDQQEEIDKLWSARHSALYAALSLAPGKKSFTTDICVPISSLTECILETKKRFRDPQLLLPQSLGMLVMETFI